jgi:hypothetical protein
MNSLEMSGTVTIAQRKAEVDEQFARSCQVSGNLRFLHHADTRQDIVTNIAAQFEDLLNGHMEGAKDHMGMCYILWFCLIHLTFESAQREKSWVERGVEVHASFVKLMKAPTHKCLMQKRGTPILPRPCE